MSTQQYLKAAMQTADINQVQLAAKTQIKQQTISKILTGENKTLRYTNAKKIADFFGDKIETVYGE